MCSSIVYSLRVGWIMSKILFNRNSETVQSVRYLAPTYSLLLTKLKLRGQRRQSWKIEETRKGRTKSFGFTKVNVNNLNSLSAQNILLQSYLSVSLFNIFFYQLCCLSCGILISQPGIEPGPLRVKVQTLHHSTASAFCIYKQFSVLAPTMVSGPVAFLGTQKVRNIVILVNQLQKYFCNYYLIVFTWYKFGDRKEKQDKNFL